ncbi:hypothetical protein ACIBAG_30430 [Streptomyces sp. NPDC051243]|uniref:hypothetical protein n=1 Tax=Streptomyces sp. NPDC051243 TaxID=3365646 RepID=UPI003788F1D7
MAQHQPPGQIPRAGFRVRHPPVLLRDLQCTPGVQLSEIAVIDLDAAIPKRDGVAACVP